MNTDVMFSSARDDWETPQDVFDMLDAEFHFTLDPCADPHNHKCSKYYTKEQDGLIRSWKGERVFCNPPYGSELKYWVSKALSEANDQSTIVVMLIPARTDTLWFHNYIYQNPTAEVRFIKGRLKFGGSKNSAPFPSMIVIFR